MCFSEAKYALLSLEISEDRVCDSKSINEIKTCILLIVIATISRTVLVAMSKITSEIDIIVLSFEPGSKFSYTCRPANTSFVRIIINYLKKYFSFKE